MITESFDNRTEAIIHVDYPSDVPAVDACIFTFSHIIEEAVLKRFSPPRIGTMLCSTGEIPVYLLSYGGKKIAFYKTHIGAPMTVALLEDTRSIFKTDRFVFFGGAGCLNKEIARGKVMVPTAAYRDEGTSYHYAPAGDYIKVKNCEKVAAFMKQAGLPFILGKTWTTDAFYRETRGNFQKHKDDGCISVEMECAGVQAMCDFYGFELFCFFTGGDLLDAPEWDARHIQDNTGTQHDTGHFDIALELTDYITNR